MPDPQRGWEGFDLFMVGEGLRKNRFYSILLEVSCVMFRMKWRLVPFSAEVNKIILIAVKKIYKIIVTCFYAIECI
jgi:hypothetical protein